MYHLKNKVMKNKTLLTILAATLLLLATSCKVEVENVTLNKAVLTLAVGASETLTATVTPAKAEHGALTWTSSNPAIATVDPDGKVTAVADGTAIIMVAVAGKTAGCRVTVSQDPPPPPRIERWLPIADYREVCGLGLWYNANWDWSGDEIPDLYDTNKSAIFINWTDSTYYSHYGTGSMRPSIRGRITITGNGGNPAVFPTITFSNGFCDSNMFDYNNTLEISYYGDYTSVPALVFNYDTYFITTYGIPNQFGALRTFHYDGNHERILYYAVFNYPY